MKNSNSRTTRSSLTAVNHFVSRPKARAFEKWLASRPKGSGNVRFSVELPRAFACLLAKVADQQKCSIDQALALVAEATADKALDVVVDLSNPSLKAA